MKKNIVVVFISDDKYSVNTAVAIASLKHNRNTDIYYKVILISDNISGDKIDKIKLLDDIYFEIKIIEHTSDFTDFSVKHTYVSTSALLKFFLADILNTLDKVIYIDGDVIVQSDLEDLYDIELGDNYAAAVRDIIVEEGAPDFVKNLNRKYYFNSGMMLLNLRQMRENNIGERLLEYKKNGLNQFMDQDALNVVFGDRVIYIDYKFNYFASTYQNLVIEDLSPNLNFEVSKTEVERLAEASIVHFAGKDKPWNIYMPYLTDIFMKYYRMSPFADKMLNLQKEDMRQSQYLFPFELVKKDSKIAIWGAGKVGTVFYQQVRYTNYCDIVLWVDRKAGDIKMQNKGVVLPSELRGTHVDYIVIAAKPGYLVKSIKDEINDLTGNLNNVIWRYPEIS